MVVGGYLSPVVAVNSMLLNQELIVKTLLFVLVIELLNETQCFLNARAFQAQRIMIE